MDRLRIDEAFKAENDRRWENGDKRLLKMDLARLLWSNTSENTARKSFTMLCKGQTKRVSVEFV